MWHHLLIRKASGEVFITLKNYLCVLSDWRPDVGLEVIVKRNLFPRLSRLVLVWTNPQQLPEKGLGNVCLFSLCEQLSASGVDVIFHTAHQWVYVLGARKFFQINTAWFNLGGQTYQATNSINRWGNKPVSHWLLSRAGRGGQRNEILINVGGLRTPPTVYDGQFISLCKVNIT